MNNIYFDSEHPGAFAGPYKLYKIIKKIGKPTSYNSVEKWLQDQDAFTLIRPVKYKFKRQRIVIQARDDVWAAELAGDMNLSQHNIGIHFLIDVFAAKYLYGLNHYQIKKT